MPLELIFWIEFYEAAILLGERGTSGLDTNFPF
jgi:hypothetical protein